MSVFSARRMKKIENRILKNQKSVAVLFKIEKLEMLARTGARRNV